MFGSVGRSANVTSVCGPSPLSSVANQAMFGVVPESVTATIWPLPSRP